MEKINLNFKGVGNIITSICWILSVISWLLFLITGWISIFNEHYNVWTIPKNVKVTLNLLFIKFEGYPYVPIQIAEPFIYIAFILTLGTSSLGFIIYLTYSIFIKTGNVFNEMMGTISRFHFISFICGSALFIIGEEINDSDNKRDLVVASLIFSIIGLCSLSLALLSQLKKTMEPWHVSILIKKGTFSCLIVLFTYSICYTIFQIGLSKEVDNLSFETLVEYLFKEDHKVKIIDFINNCGTALPIVIGLVNIGLSFALRDVMISVMNLIIFIGMTIFYYDAEERAKKFFKSNGDGVIDIIMIVLSSVTIALLLFIYKTLVLK